MVVELFIKAKCILNICGHIILMDKRRKADNIGISISLSIMLTPNLMTSKLLSEIDHIVIASPSLDEGVKYVYETLGVMPQFGGVHTRMGTHNSLLRLGNSIYLEVIAINPETPKPDNPRWFALDKPGENVKPKLLTWVARTNDIKLATANFLTLFGDIEPMNRADLNWLITIPPDGSLPLNGVCPSLIQWLNEPHSATKLSDSGCSIIGIEGYHYEAKQIRETLQSIGFEGTFSVSPIQQSEKPYLIAHIQTPNGIRKFES